MKKELYDGIHDALKSRTDWATKQEGAYRLRYGGIRRMNKPYPNAPDMHYPLSDTDIDKLKPLFIQQLYANDTLANFIATLDQTPEDSTAAAEWFDYQVKQKSNFEREIYSAIDQFLEGGFISVKVYYHATRKKLCFSTIDNLHVIVPQWTEELQDADWLVHVLHVSEAQYKANPLYDHDEDLIKEIKGKGDSRTNSGETYKRQSEELREGLTCGQTDDEIVLWEVYRRSDESEDATWMVETISPLKGCETPIRPMFGLPFDHGKLPFFKIRCEITKKGWYTSRGIPELVAPFQMGLKKLWDSSLEHLDFHGKPTYENTGTSPIPNAGNFRTKPGDILPPGLKPVVNPGAPIDYEKQMGLTRALAEDRIAIPDLGSSQHLNGRQGKSDQTTATEVNAIVGISGQSNDMRARVFRLDLADGYEMAWLTLLQYKKDEIAYLLDGEMKQVPQTALHEHYIIQPNGSPDSWNKGAQLQKAIVRFNMFRGDPFINQGELRKSVLELDDSRLVKRLFQDPGAEQEQQAEQQAQEISIMLLGYPAAVSQADDDKTHLMTLAQFVQRRLGQNEPISAEVARLFLMHGGAHSEALKQKKDPALRQIEQQLMPVIQILSALASQPEQPSNVVQMPGTMQPQGGIAPSGSPSLTDGGPASAPGDQGEPAVDTAVKVGNMLTNMVKAGIPVTHAEINKVMQEAGLGPLSLNPTTVSQLNGTDGQPMLTDQGAQDTGNGGPAGGRPNDGMIMPPVPAAGPPINVINFASKKTIKVRREKDGSLTGEVTETMPSR